ncbi:MAG: hypothetical protein QM775_02130 [Pirellulales bacterium]
MLKLSWLVAQNLARNPLRTLLTMLGTMVLVVAVTLIWSILAFLDAATAEKTDNLKAIVSERWRVPSQMPPSYAKPLQEGAARDPTDYKVPPQDSMTWSFFGGTLDPASKSFENAMFAFCLEPEKLLTMMDELDELQPEPRAARRRHRKDEEKSTRRFGRSGLAEEAQQARRRPYQALRAQLQGHQSRARHRRHVSRRKLRPSGSDQRRILAGRARSLQT